jgi:hypothetical protein
MASSSSARDSHFAPTPLKASLTSVHPVFLLPLTFAFNAATLLCLKSLLPFYLFLQELRYNLITPVDVKPGLAFLGPMGDIDPTKMINFETD